MLVEALFIVRDPTRNSTLADILWQVRVGPGVAASLPRLDQIVRGSEPDAMFSERWSFYTEADEARRDAERRMVIRDGRQTDIAAQLRAQGLRLANESEPGWYVPVLDEHGEAKKVWATDTGVVR